MTEFYSKVHDLLKLCDNYKGVKIHYCPDCLGSKDNDLLSRIKKANGFRALQHHCVFRFAYKKHCCTSKNFYPISIEDFLLSIADVKASVISRKLNVAFRRGKGEHKRIIWNAYHLWVNKKISECAGTAPADDTLLLEIDRSKSLNEVFDNRKEQIKKRSEDAWKCPFSSLMTHSLLTEKWFKFLVKNSDYFNLPKQIESVNEARKIGSNIQGSNNKKYPREGLPIYFIRLKLFTNQGLSRIADTEIINKLKVIIEGIPNYFDKSQELYKLYDEIIFVISDPKKDIRDYIEETLQGIDQFTTNYYFEGNVSKSKLLSKDLLLGYEKLFNEFGYTFYPALKDNIAPVLQEVGDDNVEAYHAKLCELCNMAEATKTFWKFNDEEQQIHECLCNGCFSIRDAQRKINEAVKYGREVPHGIGYKIAKWENEKPFGKLCFIKIDLDLNLLNSLFKDILFDEFPLKKPTDKYNDENIGFSIIHEFLTKYEEFLLAFKDRFGRLEKFNIDFRDTKTGVSNEFKILDNFICLRLDDVSEMKDILRIFTDIYIEFFPQFSGLDDSKNKDNFPIVLSATISNIKFPFFEAWRYLNRQKINFINILVVRSFEFKANYREYQNLSKLDFKGERISSFLHKLVEVDKRSHSDLLIHTEIFNHRNIQWEIFNGVKNNDYDVNQLMSFYKLVK